jgi:hypothetical protein
MKFKRGELVEVVSSGRARFGVCVVMKVPTRHISEVEMSHEKRDYAYHLWSTRKNEKILIYEEHIDCVDTQENTNGY